MIALKLRCPVHPRYMAALPPRTVACTGCNCAGIWTIAEWARGKGDYFAPTFTRLLVYKVEPVRLK